MCFSMNGCIKDNNCRQTFYDDDSNDLIVVEKQSTVPNSRKIFSHPVVSYDDSNEETTFKEKEFVTPDTLFSPKDKVSNLTWNNKLPLSCDVGITTSQKNGGRCGCVVQLDYESIINSNDVVTGAVLSSFDRCVYDAVVTLHVAGNSTFTTTDIWHIISQNFKAKLNPVMRQKIIRSMFHISKFWISIVTDDSNKFGTWCSLSRNSPFDSERKIYKKLQATYTGRLLDFRVIGNITFDVTYFENDQKFTEKQSFPDIWKLGFPPILYQYAKAKGQISATPVSLIDTTKSTKTVTAVRRGVCTNELANFLTREIDTMKKTAKRKQPYSRIILLDRIYKIDGIDDIQQDINSLKKKKSRTRDKLSKILQHFKENGLIEGHLFHKKVHGKSLSFHSVEILLCHNN